MGGGVCVFVCACGVVSAECLASMIQTTFPDLGPVA
jgi:hypothetical protein